MYLKFIISIISAYAIYISHGTAKLYSMYSLYMTVFGKLDGACYASNLFYCQYINCSEVVSLNKTILLLSVFVFITSHIPIATLNMLIAMLAALTAVLHLNNTFRGNWAHENTNAFPQPLSKQTILQSNCSHAGITKDGVLPLDLSTTCSSWVFNFAKTGYCTINSSFV